MLVPRMPSGSPGRVRCTEPVVAASRAPYQADVLAANRSSTPAGLGRGMTNVLDNSRNIQTGQDVNIMWGKEYA
jgi:hypothetical protein